MIGSHGRAVVVVELVEFVVDVRFLGTELEDSNDFFLDSAGCHAWSVAGVRQDVTVEGKWLLVEGGREGAIFNGDGKVHEVHRGRSLGECPS